MIGEGNRLERALAPGAGWMLRAWQEGWRTGWAGSTVPQHGLAAAAPAARLQEEYPPGSAGMELHLQYEHSQTWGKLDKKYPKNAKVQPVL